MGSLAYLPILVLCAGLTAFIAHSKDRRPLVWFFVGLFTGPLGVIIMLMLGDR